MTIISIREFRSNQGKYLGMVSQGEDVILKSRDFGSFKLTPVTEDDALMGKEEFRAKIEEAREQIKRGEYISFESAEEAIRHFES